MHVIYLQLDSSSSAGRFRAFLVFQARRAASDLELRILSVLATESRSSLGHEVNTLKCKTFIQAFGGKSLCLNSASAARTCINIDHGISIIQGKRKYIPHINLGYATLVYATFHSGICHFPFWDMALSIPVYDTFHFGICHFQVPF